jgi:alpha-amylase
MSKETKTNFNKSMMAIKFFVLIAAILHVDASRYAGVSVQLFEWSWSDVALECETFLSVKGYRALHPQTMSRGPSGGPGTSR